MTTPAPTTLPATVEEHVVEGQFIPADRRPTRKGVVRVLFSVAMYSGPSFWDTRMKPDNSPPRARK